MATHDYVIANASGAAVRSDLNNALAAIVSNNSNATAPATTYAYMWWVDTTNGQLKQRNAANDDWIVIRELDGTLLMEDGSAASPGLAFANDLDTGFFLAGTNQLGIATNGIERVEFGTTAVVFNDGGNNIDFRIEGDNNANLFFIDAGNDRIGLGTSSPGAFVDLAANNQTGSNTLRFRDTDTTTAANQQIGKIEFYSSDSSTPGAGVKAYIGAFASSTTPNAYLAFATDELTGTPIERMRISADGKVGIGVTNPDQLFHISSGENTRAKIATTDTASFGQLYMGDEDKFLIGYGSTHPNNPDDLALKNDTGEIFFATGTLASAERLRITDAGNVLVGTSSAATSGSSQYALLAVQGNTLSSGSGGLISLQRGEASAGGNITSGENIGGVVFGDSDGQPYGSIVCDADATSGTNDYPGRLVFSTTSDGASSPTERMRIANDGTVLIGKTSAVNTDNGFFVGNVDASDTTAVISIANTEATDTSAVLVANRQGSDGRLVQFRQANTTEGTISVSGTTVTYGGGHLARWSQLPDDGDPSGILKGTIMSNLDEMCEWGEEDNEQLNKTKVSDVEGDPNVAGVFVSTSFDEDGPLDFFVAMTGDMIIRIGQGITVQRGDLLMSAGDGTAKPQDDDIIRSKTVAKVTSTHVTCTYDDGSYCVPCVLMAC